MKIQLRTLGSIALLLIAVAAIVLWLLPATHAATHAVLARVNDAGIWNILTVAIAAVIGRLLLSMRKQSVQKVSVHSVFRLETGHPQYRNVIAFEVRNLLDGPIVLHAPHFRFDQLKPSRFAHGDTASGEFEVKFRPGAITGLSDKADARSWMTLLLRHRETAVSYVPIDDDIGKEAFLALLERNRLGALYLDVVEFTHNGPQVHRLRVPMRNLQPSDVVPPLGRPWSTDAPEAS
ncbi:hypothetical protein [Pseudoxanthomonas sp.]|uniref:hypothetical protein n=1 Tax=Pseudoxanthomonas sp. TaxID=1871049 RepID=UPI002E0FA9D6|nr:hypothetical protein [Pseudoxanthomonas sp.]